MIDKSRNMRGIHADNTEKPLIIFGCGEIAEIACFYFLHDSGRKVVAFTVDAEFLREGILMGLPVIAFDQLEKEFSPKIYDLFVAVGYSQLNLLRAAKCRAAKEKGYQLASYVSSHATVWNDFRCGENCLILEDNTIQPFSQIGNNVFIWSGNHIGHHAVIGDDTFIASHVVISGGVRVGRRCFFGVNAATHDHIEISDDCVIGAGSIVNRSLPPGSVLMPAPSRLAAFGSGQLKGVFARSKWNSSHTEEAT